MPVSSNAQNDNQWFYAWSFETDSLVSYNVNGDRHTIIETDSGWFGFPFYLESGDIIETIRINETERHLYLLRNGHAQRLIPHFDTLNIRLPSEGAYTFIESGTGFVVFTPKYAWHLDTLPAFLVDLNNYTIDVLPTNVRGEYDCCRFSENGQLLRYYGIDESTNSVTVQERSLLTGEEHVVFVVANVSRIEADRYGERWLIQLQDEEYFYTTLLFDEDDFETIVPRTPYVEQVLGFLEEDLFIYDTNCQARCYLELHQHNTEAPLLFELPSTNTWRILSRIDRQTLVVADFGWSSFWLLHADLPPNLIGYNPCQSFGYSECILDVLSPDGRWAFVVDEPNSLASRYFMQNILTGDTLLEGQCCSLTTGINPASVRYMDNGFIQLRTSTLTRDWEIRHLAYFYDNGTGVELPATGERYYFEILVDNSLLYMQRYSNIAERNSDIYLYDPHTRTSSLVLSNAYPLFRDLFIRG